jgi:hypothetical protein
MAASALSKWVDSGEVDFPAGVKALAEEVADRINAVESV